MASPSTSVDLRDARPEDFPRILKLNDAEVAQTSPMDLDRLRYLADMSIHHRVALIEGEVTAFLLAFRDDAPYQNDNFGWFAARLPGFLYIDRIVVDARRGGLGIGSKMYQDLFSRARVLGIRDITCEYNLLPPNPASAAFHAKHGFKELGRQWVAGGTKWVSLQSAPVGA